ncbi:MFS transporter, DHA1 family, bicyclomycin/chloramphenicol resistance protein [Loktanella sp. DSM 29012]|uniref:multidrug effflux MFS transporter n=1 Tax=Loktanella sp. DSM 29012 TaxID=1881056 RepID=UPI0008D5F3FF|nr:multidrug effflux MFS transporter [Loktanella sp. DSM 29012]SEQ29829.1 MFS transporter, DHA1 family, bicyclomycin/chloramphenicol resistance protein [Loktanella sp. DSM 29012]
MTARTTPIPRKTGTDIPYVEFVAMMALLMALNSAAIDVYIPALQNIGTALYVSDENQRQFVISAYVLGFGGAQVIYGPLSDRFGRRPILFAGLAIYLIGALAAVFVPTFGALLAMRFVQGVGAAATRVIATAAVRDRFAGEQMASVMSLVMMVFMIMPVLAPNLGSLIMLWGNWREVSGVMFGIGAGAFVWTWFRLRETLAPADRRPLQLRPVAEAFRIVLTNRISVGYLIAMGSFFAFVFAFIAQAEQIYTQIYGMGAEFTLWFSVVALVMSVTAFVNSKLVARFGTRRLSHAALCLFIVVTLLHLGLAVAAGGHTPFWLFITLFTVMMSCVGIVPPNFNALAMNPLGHVAGVGSAVLGAAQTVLGGVLGGIVGYLYDGTLIPLLGGGLVLASVALAAAAWAEGGTLFARRSDA